MKFVKGQSGNPAGRSKGSFNFAGPAGAPHGHPCAIFLLFPCSVLLFRPISRLRADFIADLHFARPHLQGFYRDLARGKAEAIIDAAIKAAKDGRRWGDAPLLGSLCARAQKCARSARVYRHPYQFHPHHDQRVDRGQLVVPEGSDVAREIDEYVRIIRGRALEKRH